MELYVLSALVTSLFMVESRTIIDLTHTFDENAPSYPLKWVGATNFTYYKLKPIIKQYYGDMWLELNTIEFYEHQGTHIDAPNHFGKGRQSLEEIPASRLVGPGVVINIKDKVKTNHDYAVTVEDIREHEAEHGLIPPDAIISLNSGWGLKYPNSSQVFGSQTLEDPTTFHFPGWSLEACKFLLEERQVSVVGTDTPSIDPGNPPGYPCHMYLQPNNVPLLEYVANLDRIPPRGTTIVLGAMKVRGGSGGPTRIFAFMDEEMDHLFGSAPSSVAPFNFILLLLYCAAVIY